MRMRTMHKNFENREKSFSTEMTISMSRKNFGCRSSAENKNGLSSMRREDILEEMWKL